MVIEKNEVSKIRKVIGSYVALYLQSARVTVEVRPHQPAEPVFKSSTTTGNKAEVS